MNWNEGYYTDREYTYGYYRELNPYRSVLALLHKGFTPPRFRTACELGFGQGVSLAVHAASSHLQWWGTDFMPSHGFFAREVCSGLDRPPKVFDDSFSEFLQRDLPGFDFIGLHGVLSWISPSARRDVFDFVRRRLNPGGVLYVSYNSAAGWGPLASVRRILRQCFLRQSASLGFEGRVRAAVAETIASLRGASAYQKLYPTGVSKLEELQKLSPNYLAHELLNEHWELFQFEDLAAELQACKLDYCTSMHIPEHFEPLYFTEEQVQVMEGLGVNDRESMRDVLMCQTFRRDVWQRGSMPWRTVDSPLLEDYVVHAISDFADFPFELKGGLRKAALERSHYEPIIGALRRQPRWLLGELISQFGRAAVECLMVLQHFDLIGLSVESGEVGREGLMAFNRRLIEQGAIGGQLRVLASPVSGGVSVDHVSLILLHLIGRGTVRSQLGPACQSFLQSHGFSLRDQAGEALLDPAASLVECERRIENFYASIPLRLKLLGLEELLHQH